MKGAKPTLVVTTSSSGKLTKIEVPCMSGKALEIVASGLKRRLACGGTVKEGRIVLQGDHRDAAANILQRLIVGGGPTAL